MGLEENLLNFPEARKLTAEGERSDDLAMELLFGGLRMNVVHETETQHLDVNLADYINGAICR